MTKSMHIAHLVWVVFALAACALLVFGGGGHPPPIIFLPVIFMIWAVGHVALWGGEKLAARGRAQSGGEASASGPWPLGIKCALFGTGVAASVGLVQVTGSLFLGRTYPFHGVIWTVTMFVWVLHGLCFAGLLLRRRWSQTASALIATGWGLVIVYQMVDYVVKGQRINMLELGIGIALTTLLIGFGSYLLLSKNIGSFLAAGGKVRD